MPVTYNLIASNTLSSSAASVTFSAIPGTYTDLVLRISARFDSSSSSIIDISFNSNTSNYSNRYLQANGFSAASGNNFGRFAGVGNTSGETSNTFSNSEIYIPTYTASNNKPYSSASVAENNATAAFTFAIAGLWSNSATITSVTLTPVSGNFVSGSSFFLYGIKNS